ncbi:MAG TPA: Maf family protein [Solirubrobacteraceae bacterium]|nr:Maf family protein [Solirubrobacteraceae bacterium]
MTPAKPARRLLLASRSPQRKAILEQLGVPFEVRPADVEELETGNPFVVATENAARKAGAVSGDLVLGADTVVALEGRILGKPADEAQAREFIQALASRTHVVVGGLAVRRDGEERSAAVATSVTFRNLGAAEVDRYVASGEWRERAGGYAIQGRGATLVRTIEGDYLNVVGLSVATLIELVPDLRDPVPPRP